MRVEKMNTGKENELNASIIDIREVWKLGYKTAVNPPNSEYYDAMNRLYEEHSPAIWLNAFNEGYKAGMNDVEHGLKDLREYLLGKLEQRAKAFFYDFEDAEEVVAPW